MSSPFRIHDLPEEDRPRERLLRLGAGALTNAELLALFINTGLKGENAIAIAHRLLKEHGNLTALSRREASELAEERGLGPAKAAHIAAAFELGRRASREIFDERKMDTPDLIYEYLASEMSALNYESVRVILLNTKMALLQQREIFRGSVNESVAHPREILREALVHSAAAFVVVHNHPSGDPMPSEADRRFTMRLRDAAGMLMINFVDHVIIGLPREGKSPFFSFRQTGLI